jgi:Carboxypeptidase regulatory-like domain
MQLLLQMTKTPANKLFFFSFWGFDSIRGVHFLPLLYTLSVFFSPIFLSLHCIFNFQKLYLIKSNFTMTFKSTLKNVVLSAVMMLLAAVSFAQVTTSSMVGNVKDSKGEELIGATVIAVHTPTGTQYGTSTNEQGRFTILNMRIGGPYKMMVSYLGFKTFEAENIFLKLGEPAKFNVTVVEEATAIEQVEVIYRKNALISNQRTGAATNVNAATLSALPTLSRSITDFTKLTPQSKGFSFAGMDNRFNNFQIDGSAFNNNFGLQELPGAQTNSTPISLDAIEEININIAPYDVRQGGFAGAAVNAVTRSGSNTFSGSAFANYRSDKFMGDSIGQVFNGVKTPAIAVPKAAFNVKQVGFRLGGPIVKDKLFFFINGETELRTDPGTVYSADTDTDAANNTGNTTRVTTADLNDMRAFLKSKYNYETGDYQGYTLGTTSYKALARIDYNINKNNKFNVRYNYLRSKRDVPPSNSGSSGGRGGNLNAMSFQNSNYIINNDIQSVVAELNSTIGAKASNKIIAGFTANRDYRGSNSTPFPLVDILKAGVNYMTFGYEQFTPNNTLNTDTWQLSDQFSYYAGKHTISAGFNIEKFKFTNIFTPNYYGQYVFNSIDDFKKSANGDATIAARNYNASYSILDDRSPWAAVTKVTQAGAYIQDEWDVLDNLRLTGGIRIDVPFFNETTPLVNPNVPNHAFYDEKGNLFRMTTGFKENDGVDQTGAAALPKSNPNISPRIGFNWDVMGDKKTQIRGGAGYFAGRPPYVWLSNNVGNNGMFNGTLGLTNYKVPFSADVDARTNPNLPKTITTPAATYDLAGVDPNFRFPQTLRGSIAVDHKLPFGLVLSLEGMASRTVNDILYIDGNLTRSFENFTTGPDQRAKFQGAGKLKNNAVVNSAAIIKNSGKSNAQYFTVTLEKQMDKNWGGKVAYNYGKALDLMHAGSIAINSWRDALSVNGNNYITDLGYSRNDQRHRIIAAGSYKINWGKVTSTQISLVAEARNQGNYSYSVQGDINFDGLSGNDLMYIPKADEKLKFVDILDSKGTVLFNAAAQQDAFEKYITNDKYLSANRGKYAQRNGGLLPWVYNFDLNIAQNVYFNIAGKTQTFQIRADIFNFANLLNNAWGVGYRFNVFDSNRSATSIVRAALDKDSKAVGKVTDQEIQYQVVPFNGKIDYAPLTRSANLGDTWSAQLGIRWSF